MKKALLIRKIIRLFFSIFAALTINFFIFRILPGDPIRLLFRDPRIPEEYIASLRHRFGLDQPLINQYFLYLLNTLRGDLGISYVFRKPVIEIVFPALLNSVILAGTGYLLAIPPGILIGMLSAWKRGKLSSNLLLGLSLMLYSLPTFWLAGLMVVTFAVFLKIFPTSGMVSYTFQTNLISSLTDFLWHLALPAITYALLTIGQYALIMRGAMLETITEDYIVTAKAKGLTEWQVIRRHAFKNSIIPVVAITAINFGFIAGGAIQTETVFSWPGVGLLIYQSLQLRDYPILQGAFLILTLSVVIANFLADIIYSFLDPRIQS